ncbi:hypothetical protein NMY22_g7391 [Coprinellus aureogranulatus]|nr:hypothetical protein NMY22_g7391 [Coprinellus aureogranulatus]
MATKMPPFAFPNAGDTAANAIIWALVLAIVMSLQVCYTYMSEQRKRKLREPPHSVDYFKLCGTPLPTPVLDFDLDNTKPRPYRPLRWSYHQTMAMMPLENDWWIELESTYTTRIKQRQKLYVEHGNAVLDWLPGSEGACRELLHMVVQFLCARYPTLFSLDISTAMFRNSVLGTTYDTNAVEPLHFLLHNVPEDFLITQRDSETGLYRLTAAVSCSAVGWSLKEKMGKPLHEIHAPVPDYSTKLRTSVDRFFDRLPVDKPIQRGSWSFEQGQPLYLMADDPAFLPHKQMDPDLDINNVHLRVDWQTLRRLPQSGAIVFNFKAFFTPVTQFKHEPYIPALTSRVLRDCKQNIKAYKGWSHLEHKLFPALDRWAADQVANGVVPENWEVSTLDEHPFYPGWNLKGK